ncbi:putative peptidyl-tRNA hydrolase PTRHD1 [Iris pallida]|uniref:peptidyl-tRNA hydrolase n=1 Tax=Iris pallida TaxID=29817 RepID=A0AAX6EJC3_IRIPA|nr:putative peptidyl-tRNA hydrolase PTRHD1 [Iris pallida]
MFAIRIPSSSISFSPLIGRNPNFFPLPPPSRSFRSSMSAAAAAPEREEKDVVVQYVVLRRDLIDTWPVGSVVAQGCHASVAAVWAHRDHPDTASYLSPSAIDSMHKACGSGSEGGGPAEESVGEAGGGRGRAQAVDRAAGGLPDVPRHQALPQVSGGLLLQEAQALQVVVVVLLHSFQASLFNVLFCSTICIVLFQHTLSLSLF